MQPIHPLDNRPTETPPYDYIQDYESGPGWFAVLSVIIVVALIVGAVIWIGGGATEGAPTQTAPNEAPVNPGS